MMLDIAFYSEDSSGVGDAVNVFIFPDLCPLAGSETDLLTRMQDAVFCGETLTYFSNTRLLLGCQIAAPVESWDKSASQIKAWEVFYAVFLVMADTHPYNAKMIALVKETTCVCLCLCAECHLQPILFVNLLCLIHTEYNESFHQALEQRLRVAWTDFDGLERELATGNFSPEMVIMPGFLLPE